MQQDIWDGNWLLMETDPDSKRSVWVTHQDGQFVFRIDMPLDDIFDANHEAEAETMGRRFGDYNRIASVPLSLAYSSGLSEAVDQQDGTWMSRFFNNSDNKKWRTSRGKI
jgi:hypothetical protein